ncbi:nitroreductase family protein [Aestuariivivens sediminicola]|uniref:nitroreductase family protein n=1 Tax=Aestuariivivens sediminicola TaxID=2913560 RepID=UPI001F580577|nr:nitroreductase family protein [Aestuariivivens sediminicola]
MPKDHIEINGFKHIKYKTMSCTPEASLQKSLDFFEEMNGRRSIREYAKTPVPRKVIENIIKTASTAPSGAHKQPWMFCAVSNPELKSKIRKAAEKEERESYTNRMSERWLKDLEPLGTNPSKPFIEEAPWLIVAFKKVYNRDQSGTKNNNYYVNESIGIACGMLITAIHKAGLVTLTHTPSPMHFLTQLLDRPSNERAFLLLPVGYPKDPVYVPDIQRKPLNKVAQFYL